MDIIFIITLRRNGDIYEPYRVEFKKSKKDENILSFIKRYVGNSYEPDNLFKFSRFYRAILEKINLDIEDTPRRVFNTSYFYESRVNKYVFMQLSYHERDGITIIYDKFNNSVQIFLKKFNIKQYIRKSKLIKELVKMNIWRDVDECINDYRKDIDDYFMTSDEKLPPNSKIDAYKNTDDRRLSFLYIA